MAKPLRRRFAEIDMGAGQPVAEPQVANASRPALQDGADDIENPALSHVELAAWEHDPAVVNQCNDGIIADNGLHGEAISMDAFAYSQGLRPSELMTFARRNALSYQQMRGPRGGAQLLMSAADREAFHDRFISFRTLGFAAHLGWSELQARLDAGAIQPAGGSADLFPR